MGEWPTSLHASSTARADTDVDFAPQSPFPNTRGAPSRSYSEDEWSPGLEMRLSGAGSDTSSEAVFEMSKSSSECSVLGSEFGVGRSESAASLDDCPALAQVCAPAFRGSSCVCVYAVCLPVCVVCVSGGRACVPVLVSMGAHMRWGRRLQVKPMAVSRKNRPTLAQ
jgi:hypothetical protein